MSSQDNNSILTEIDNTQKTLLKLIVSITSIPAPTGHEQKRI